MSGQGGEREAQGIVYIDAVIPLTVLNVAYRMHAEWERRHRPTPPSEGCA